MMAKAPKTPEKSESHEDAAAMMYRIGDNIPSPLEMYSASRQPRVPAAVFDIPVGLRESSLGLDCNRLINPWALDRVLSHLGAHTVEIIDSIAVAPSGAYAELVRDGDTLQLFDRL